MVPQRQPKPAEITDRPQHFQPVAERDYRGQSLFEEYLVQTNA
jgi:hypothetical protein